MTKQSFGTFFGWEIYKYLLVFFVCTMVVFSWSIFDARARNINTYSDTLSDSTPGDYSNHTLKFTIATDVAPGGSIDFTPPPGFTIVATSTFHERNIKLLVNGSERAASSTGNATTDTVSITPGTPGLITYTLNPTTGVSNGDVLTLLIGNHTSEAFNGEISYSTTTGTTTSPQDIGVLNHSSAGPHRFVLKVNGGTDDAYADFLVHLNAPVGIYPVDTTEQIPPFRFNGAPTGNIGGTTLSVEISLETDEFADCRFATTTGVAYASMTNTFVNTGFVIHSQILTGLVNETTYSYYVRCIDDEDNFNTDDYEITFTVPEVPDGDPNTTGSSTGDGSGSGDADDGNDGGGDTGGGSPDSGGSSSGGGGSGGGSGGSSGGGSSSGGGGGFESSDAPYRSGDATVIINGFAFPFSDITTLVDGQIAEVGSADSNGRFSVTLEEIARGVYTFGVYATDDNNVKSTTFSTSFSVQGARTSNLSNVNIMPTVVVEPDPVDIGAIATISGFSIPDATVTIQNLNDAQSSSLKTFTTDSDSEGRWSVEVDTTAFSQGTYKTRAKAEQTSGAETNFSDYTYYGVGQQADVQINADLNRDGSVNLIDFSILLFWWGSDGGASDPPADINRDGNVSLTDFSIMLFNWTG